MAKIKINFPKKCTLNSDDENELFKNLAEKFKEHLTKILEIPLEKISVQKQVFTIFVEVDSDALSDRDLGDIISTFIENYQDSMVAMGKIIRIHTKTAHKDCFIGHC